MVLGRFMNIVEHLLPIHYIRFLAEKSLRTLSNVAFFVDGPLAVFGTAAWMHGAILRFLGNVNSELHSLSLSPVLILGLQKSGQIVDHNCLIDRFIPSNRLFVIDDEYRYKWILSNREPAEDGFGAETYYGQDFIFKTPSGRTFVFALPYPFTSKADPAIDFINDKVKLENYANLNRTLALIHHFESDLYKNAVVPIALAHRYTAISLMPGGRVLDILTRSSLENHE